MTQLLSATPARPRWRSALAIFALVGALFGAGAVAPASADIGTGPGVISGTVTDSNGLPLGGVFVQLFVPSDGISPFYATALTDDAGHYEFANLAVGYTFNLQAQLSGYQQPQSQILTLTEASPAATADFVLELFPTGNGTISGHVTGDGVPLVGTQVTANSFTSGQSVFATSDASGFYQFTGLALGEWGIISYGGNDYQPVYPPSIVLTEAAPSATLDIAFISWPVGTASVNGVVADSATGDPISSVLVSLYGVDVAHSSNVWIDAGGSFSFELLPEGNYQLTVFAPGYLYFTKNLHLAAGQSLTPNAALIAANSTISGHIIGPDGAPAAGVFVNASDLNGGGSGGETDANGDYVLTDVGATKYLVSVGGVGTTFEPQEKYATPAANGDATVDFVLTPRTTAYFSGNVLDQNGDWYVGTLCATLYSSKSKKALKDVAIWGQGWGEGTWSFDKVKPGSYTVEFRDCDDDPATKFDKVFLGGAKSYKDATFVTLTAGQDSFESVVTLTVRGNTK